MEQTVFEKIIERKIPANIVYEDANTIAILSIDPKALGHTLIIPKVVSNSILEMDPDMLGLYFTIVQKVAQAIKNSLDATGCVVLLDGREVHHTHTHIIPRFGNEGVNLNDEHHETYSSPEEMQGYADKIRAGLGS